MTGLESAQNTGREIAAVVAAVSSGWPLPPLAPQPPVQSAANGRARYFCLNLLLTVWLLHLTFPCVYYFSADCTSADDLPFLAVFLALNLLNAPVGDFFRLFDKNLH